MTNRTTLLGTSGGSALDTVEVVAFGAPTSSKFLVVTTRTYHTDHVIETTDVKFQWVALLTFKQSLI